MRVEASAREGGRSDWEKNADKSQKFAPYLGGTACEKSECGQAAPLTSGPLAPYLRDDEEHPKRLRLTRFAQTKRDKRARAGAEKEGLPRTLRRQIGDAKEFS